MSLTIKNTKDLQSDTLKLKMLVYGPSGVGKSTFAATAPNPIIAACETGHGNGLLSVASSGHDYCMPESYAELEQFCSGHGLEKYDSIVIDGFSYLTDTIIKSYALTVPRSQGDSGKRKMGVPELDDFGTMAELERRLLAKLLSLDKHIIVTCLMDYYQPATKDKAERMGGPDLPGMMRLGSAAMFDVVLRLWTRPVLKNPQDAKSRYNQRYFLTDTDGQYLAKSRVRNGKTSLFPVDVEFNPDAEQGTFGWFLKTAQEVVVAKQG